MAKAISLHYRLHSVTDVVDDPDTNLLEKGRAVYIPQEHVLATIEKSKVKCSILKQDYDITVLVGDEADIKYLSLCERHPAPEREPEEIADRIVNWLKAVHLAQNPPSEAVAFLHV